MAIFSQRVALDNLPVVDNTSFFKNLVSTVGDAIDRKTAGDLVAQSVRNSQAAQNVPYAAPQQQPQMSPGVTNTAPVSPVIRGQQQGSTFQPFIDTVKAGGLTNPYGLAAVAATGRAESGFSPQNAAGAWSDPSQSGQAGTAGGVLSWRADRLQALRNYAATKGEQGNGSPQTQAEFFLQENPQVTAQLQNARSPEEAANIMANAWKFAGYNQPGGEAARRQALTRNYYATTFGNQQEPIVPQSQGDSDPSTMTPAGLQTALGPAPQPTPQAQPGYVDPTVTTAFRGNAQGAAPTVQTQQVIQPRTPQSPGVIASGVTPLTRQNVDPDLIRRLVQNPLTREYGLGVAQQVLGNKPNSSWDFVKLDDGTLARANKQTGAVETLGNFQSAKKNILSNGKGSFLDADTGQWITPPPGTIGANKFGLSPIYGTDPATGQTAIGQLDEQGNFHVVDTKGFVPVGNVTNTNLGTTIVTKDKAGNVIGTSPIDVAGKTAAEAAGKNLAANQQALPSVEAASNQLLSTIDSLTNDPYLDNMLGPVNSRLPTITGEGARVQAKMDQITGQTFLQAYQTLRGGGAITDIEGQKATQSLARLNAAQNPKDYREALNEFRGIVVNAVNRARAQAGKATDAAPPSVGNSGTIRKFNPEIGKIE